MKPSNTKANIREIAVLGVLAAITLGISDILNPDVVIGAHTRDLFDHLALLDQWSIQIEEWSYPNGGSLIPPDIYSMIFATPFLPFGRGIAADMALFCQVWLVGISGWVLGKKMGSGLIGGICLQMSPYMYVTKITPYVGLANTG